MAGYGSACAAAARAMPGITSSTKPIATLYTRMPNT